LFRARAVLAQGVCYFEIASLLVVLRIEHAHRGQKRNALLADTVESLQEQNGTLANALDAPFRRRNASLGSQSKRHGLPSNDWNQVAMMRKLGNRQTSIAVQN